MTTLQLTTPPSPQAAKASPRDARRAAGASATGAHRPAPNAAASKKSAATPKKRYNPIPAYLFGLVVIAALYFGWTIRNEYYISAEYGLGYALGITGGMCMLILLLYPLKKHFSNLNLLLSTRSWFSVHMFLGLVGPTLIMYHSNFRLGSFNSNVALFCTILMVTSGLIGRFIYGKIHFGLYNKQEFLQQLQNHKVFSRRPSADGDQVFRFINTPVYDKLLKFQQRALENRGLFGSLRRFLLLGLTTRSAYYGLCRQLKKYHHTHPDFTQLAPSQKQKMNRAVHRHIAMYLNTIRRISAISLYERLFSLWHILHLPIFFMLIISGFLHVYAVHMY